MISLSTLRGGFIDFQLTKPEDPNHLTLECYTSLTGDVDVGAVIYVFNSPGDTNPRGSVLSEQTFDITPENEGFLRCNSSDGSKQSEFVAIAGETHAFKTLL
jgi:hypothetical protein